MLSRMQAADVPLDQRQLEWLIKKFDENCTGMMVYRLVCGCCVCARSSGNKRNHKVTFYEKGKITRGLWRTKMITLGQANHIKEKISLSQ